MKCPNPKCRLAGAYIRHKPEKVIVCRMCGVNTKFEELADLDKKKA